MVENCIKIVTALISILTIIVVRTMTKVIELMELTCKRCGHKWDTRSRLFFTTCPSCYTKVKNTWHRKNLEKDDRLLEDAQKAGVKSDAM